MTLKMKGLKLNQNQLQRIFKKCQDLRSKIMILFWYYFNHSVKRFRCKRVPINAHFSCLKLFARKKCKKHSRIRVRLLKYKSWKMCHFQFVPEFVFLSLLLSCDMTVESHSTAVRVILLLAIWWQQEEVL